MKYPVLAILGGGIILFLVWLIFNRLFGRREEEQPAQQLQVIPPDMRFQPPAPAGETPQWHQPFIEGQERLLEEMRGIGARLREEGRDIRFVQEIIERVEERVPDAITPTPTPAPIFTPLDPAPVYTPTPVRDQRAIDVLEADIARVEAARGRPDTVAYFQRVWGGIDAYLASQRNKLERVLGGEQDVVGQPYQPHLRTPAAPVRAPEQHPPIRVAPPIQPVLPRGATIAPPIQPVLPRPAPAPAPRPVTPAPRPAPARPSPVPPQMRPAPVAAPRPAPVAAPRPTPRPSPVPPQMRPAPTPPRVTVTPPRVTVPPPPRTTAAQRGAAQIR